MNLLSQTGELVNCVSCLAGQVSVFRAPSYAALEVYQRALAGIPGPERISLFLDDRSFIPTEHFFIGFGEQRENAHETVFSSFSRIGTSEQIFHSLCASHGIEISLDTPWNILSTCEARRVRLLLATQNRGQVIILNDPFEPLANQWRERFANLIVQFAHQCQEIVIVTNLSGRPEAWIDNPFIARIQVGEEIKRTIGFGSQPSEAQQLIQQLRSDMTQESHTTAAIATATYSPERDLLDSKQQIENEPYVPLHSSFLLAWCSILDRFHIPYNDNSLQQKYLSLKQTLQSPIISLTLASSLIIVSAGFLLSRNTTPTDGSRVTKNVAVSLADQPPGNKDITSELEISEIGEVRLNSPDQVDTIEVSEPVAKRAIDEYSISVKSAILASFQGLGTDLESRSDGRDKVLVAAQVQDETSDLLKLLATASDSGEGLPDAPPPSDTYRNNSIQNNSTNPGQYGSEEEKREAIRKRFLEAIERAQSMRRQSGEG